MDELYVTTVYVILDHLAMGFLPAPKYKPKMSVAEIILVAIVAARYFENNQERALLLLRQTGLIPKQRCLSVSRFNRQLHQQGDFLELCLQTLLELARQGEAFVMPQAAATPSIVCLCRFANGCALVVAVKSGGLIFAAFVSPKRRSSLAGVSTSSVHLKGFPLILRSCQQPTMI